ncbi:MAG: UDP-N-acetylmuramate dehydrogenase [Spirochaetota bacterium]
MLFEKNVLLKNYSNYRIGGPAKFFLRAKNVGEISKGIEEWRRLHSNGRYSDAIFILGGGTNVLFSDEIFDGLVLKPEINFIKREDNFMKVGAGTSMGELVDYFLEKGIGGLEWAAGLPGTLGGAIRGNAGAFYGETKNIIKEVISLDISKAAPKIIKRVNDECEFFYRSSIFKSNGGREIILEAVLLAPKADKKEIRDIAAKNIKYRTERQPLEHPSIGSTFKNVPLERMKIIDENMKSRIKTDPFPIIPVAYLISEAGLKGVSYGGAMVSPKHPNFIVNALDATANDVKSLISLVKNEVYKKFKVELEEEIEYADFV